MDTNGFKTILGSVTNPSISSFGTKDVIIGGGPSVSTQNFEDTGFYFNSNYYGTSAGIVKQLYFATNGNNILSLNKNGMNIYTTGTNMLPSISFTGIGSQPSGINGGVNYVSLVTGQIERFRVEGGSVLSQNNGHIYLHGNVNVEDNLYLPQPNGSSPSAGKVLTSVDTTGKVEWSDDPIALHQPFHFHKTKESSTGVLQGNTGEKTISELTITLPTDGKKYIIHVNFKCTMIESDGNSSSDTGITHAKIYFENNKVDESTFRLDIDNKDFQNWRLTHNCFWSRETLAIGQEITFRHQNEGNTDWYSVDSVSSVIGIPIID
jgi:hypothetical protein